MATLVGIKDYHLVGSKEHWSDPAWRGQVTLPPLVVELMNRAALLPLLRSFWLAFGLERRCQSIRGPSIITAQPWASSVSEPNGPV